MPLGGILGGILGGVGGLIGKKMDQSAAKKAAAHQEAVQKEFAQHGIRWKVEDAKAAGLHPLAALGANTVSYSPVSVGDVGTNFASAGQDIGRAIGAMRTPEEKSDAYTRSLQALQLERGALENTLLRSQIRRSESAGTGPGLPGLEKVQPPQRTSRLLLGDGREIPSGGSSDQQAFEDRYGEIVGEIYGLRNYWRDVVKPGLREQVLPTPGEAWRMWQGYRSNR